MKWSKIIFSIGIVHMLLSTSVDIRADEITLKNGDRISGKILEMDNSSITIKTSYAGEIKIQRQELSGLVTDAPLTFMLTDDTVVTGSAIASKPGTIKVKAGEILETAPIELENVSEFRIKGEKEPAVKLSGNANLTASISDGNSDTKNYHVDGELVARTQSNRFTMGGDFNQAEDEGDKTAENWFGHMKYDHFLSKKWYLYSHGQFTKDKFKDLNLRTTLGLGSGYQIWESVKRNLSIEGGLSFTNEDYENEEDQNYPAGRWALKYDQQFFKSAMQFFHNHELLLGLEDIKDLIFLSQTGVRFPIVKQLNAVFQIDTEYDNTPAEGNERTDTYYRAGVGYIW